MVNFAFEQVQCKYPLVKESVEEWVAEQPEKVGIADGDDEFIDQDRWLIEWDDNGSRATSIAGLAFYADEWDEDATVTRLE